MIFDPKPYVPAVAQQGWTDDDDDDDDDDDLQPVAPIKQFIIKGGKFLKKLWCCVGGE